jgi:hypothetical protein
VEKNMVGRCSPWANKQQLIHLSEKAKSIIRKYKPSTPATKTLIPKPCGRRSRDFNIFTEMNVKPDQVQVLMATYCDLIVSQLGFIP